MPDSIAEAAPRTYAGFLFDMDGTVLSSIAATERVWTRWAVRHGLDVEQFLPTIHGVRAVETVRRLGLPGVDPEAEAALLTAEEMQDVGGIAPIAGAFDFLAALPSDRWAIVTSAPRALALRRIAAAGLPVPEVLVAAEDVRNGKPAPDCFRLGAARLGLAVEDCLVFEDAPAGIQAAEAAGADVMVVTAAHQHPLATAHPLLASYHTLSPQMVEGGIRLERAATPLQSSPPIAMAG